MTRRGNSEGSIYFRKGDGTNPGRWVAALTVGWDGGKPVRRVFYAATRKEVVKKLDMAKRQYVRVKPNDDPTLTTFASTWLQEKLPHVRPNTAAFYTRIVTLYILPELGPIKLRKLEPRHVEQLQRAVLRHHSPRTAHHVHGVLSAILKKAVRWDLIGRNVATMVDGPRVEPHAPEVWTPEQARQLLHVVAGDRLEAAYVLALSLGLRLGELLGLHWQAIDWEARQLHVVLQAQRHGMVAPKTRASVRTLPLSQELVTLLHRHRQRQLQERLAAAAIWEDHGVVLTNVRGLPLPRSTLTTHFKRMLQQAGLADRPFHSLRHGCATLLAAQGVPPRVVMDLLGHTSLDLTIGTYTHALDSGKQAAVDALSRLLEPVLLQPLRHDAETGS